MAADAGGIGTWRDRLGALGAWASGAAVGRAPGAEALARQVEAAGFRALWVGGGNPDHAALAERRAMLAATEQLVVGTGIVNIWAWEPAALQAEADAIAAAHPGRFVLGLGVSHAPLVQQLGRRYERPLAAMREFLDGLGRASAVGAEAASRGGGGDAGGGATRGGRETGGDGPLRVLAALGTRMLELARDRSGGAVPYLTTPAHTAAARTVLGPGPLLAPEQAVVVTADPGRGRRIARGYLAMYLALPNYLASLRRLGFGDADFADGGSDRLVADLVPSGNAEAVAARLREHLAAGADHVAVQALSEDGAVDLAGLRELVSALA
jgi:probable F420-dependent oxidoreductase